MSALLNTKAPVGASFAFKAGSRPACIRAAVVCKATPEDAVACGRRAMVAALPLFAAALVTPRQAAALIPDEEDEEMLERAKANRQKRLLQQRETTREFLKEEGLKNGTLNQELVPVQKAVNQLAKSGGCPWPGLLSHHADGLQHPAASASSSENGALALVAHTPAAPCAIRQHQPLAASMQCSC